MSQTKCMSIGASQGLIIPNNILEEAHIHISDILDIKFSEQINSIIIKKVEAKVVCKG